MSKYWREEEKYCNHYRPDCVYDLVGNYHQKTASQQNNLKNYIKDALKQAYERGYKDGYEWGKEQDEELVKTRDFLKNQCHALNKSYEEGLRIGYQNRRDEEHESIRTMIDMSLQKCEDSTAENVSESNDPKE